MFVNLAGLGVAGCYLLCGRMAIRSKLKHVVPQRFAFVFDGHDYSLLMQRIAESFATQWPWVKVND